ncbi:OsmC family protein [Oryzifoliimicrobium ureilyticus]|uniref:OsmC family protein n=1 Tax=Oryzifoliimicrobium ureilyticus TaxID=3113724 RepID=UPI00307681B4
MGERTHRYLVSVTWTGNDGVGTKSHRSYRRDHEIKADTKPAILGSSDPSFRGDPTRWNPEELLVASLSACHKLWYLGLCADAGVTVLSYEDEAEGVMAEESSGAGQFTSVTLRPKIEISAASDRAKAEELHHTAHDMCFIARSVKFPVTIEPIISSMTGIDISPPTA